jgi:hypothetical protein
VRRRSPVRMAGRQGRDGGCGSRTPSS